MCTHHFKRLGEVERCALGMPGLAMAIAQHPFGGLNTEAVRVKADDLLEQVIQGLTSS